MSAHDKRYRSEEISPASSSVFNTILKKHSHPHPFIYLKGAKAVDMDAMVEFMYRGEVKVGQDQLKSFIDRVARGVDNIDY